MVYRPLAMAIAGLCSAHIATAAAQSVYVAPGGVYVAGGPVYVVPAPGNGNGTYGEPISAYGGGVPEPYLAPRVVAPRAGYVAVAPYDPGGGYENGYGGTPVFNGDPVLSTYDQAGYAYAPSYSVPPEYDSSGAPISRTDLGWQWGPPNGAPVNPCTLGQRQQNRC